MAASERRRIRRHPGTGLVAHVGGGEFEVLDISLGGLRLAHGHDLGRGEIRIRISRRHGRGDGAVASVVLVARGERDLHLKFVGMNYPLAQLIVEHVARVSGTAPYIFR